MTPVTAAKVTYGVWGLIGGAIIAMIIGFAWGGWTTSGTTQRMGGEAVLAARAAICVAQFMKEPNHQEKLQELEKVSSYHGFFAYPPTRYIPAIDLSDDGLPGPLRPTIFVQIPR